MLPVQQFPNKRQGTAGQMKWHNGVRQQLESCHSDERPRDCKPGKWPTAQDMPLHSMGAYSLWEPDCRDSIQPQPLLPEPGRCFRSYKANAFPGSERDWLYTQNWREKVRMGKGGPLHPKENRSWISQKQGRSDTPGQCSHSLTTGNKSGENTHIFIIISSLHFITGQKKSLPVTFIYYNSEVICLKDSNWISLAIFQTKNKKKFFNQSLAEKMANVFKIAFIYFQRKEKGGKHQLVASHTHLTRNQTSNPGMCPDWESNWWPFVLRNDTQSSHTTQWQIALKRKLNQVFLKSIEPSFKINEVWHTPNREYLKEKTHLKFSVCNLWKGTEGGREGLLGRFLPTW